MIRQIKNHKQKGAFGNQEKGWDNVAEKPKICKQCAVYKQPKCTKTDRFVKRTSGCKEFTRK